MRKLLVLLVVVGLVFGGCASKRWVTAEIDTALNSSYLDNKIDVRATNVFDANFTPAFKQAIVPLKQADQDLAIKTEAVRKEIIVTLADLAILKTPILFAFNKSDLNSVARVCLLAKARIMTKYPDLRVSVVGYASRIGKEIRNVALSKARAEAVKMFLMSQCIDGSRMDVTYRAFQDSAGHLEEDRKVVLELRSKSCGGGTLCK